jgi:Mg2+-importing ATPase
MAFISVFLSFFQEYRAGKEAERLSEMVRATATVIRNGKAREVKIRDIVPGDIIDLYAGDMVPADIRIISCKDLFINQASLTGESFPVEKTAEPLTPKNRTPSDLTNMAFMGSSVISGTAIGVAVKTGLETRFGALSKRLAAMAVESSFDKGIRNFTWLMIRIMVVLVLVIFAINAFR